MLAFYEIVVCVEYCWNAGTHGGFPFSKIEILQAIAQTSSDVCSYELHGPFGVMVHHRVQ